MHLTWRTMARCVPQLAAALVAATVLAAGVLLAGCAPGRGSAPAHRTPHASTPAQEQSDTDEFPPGGHFVATTVTGAGSHVHTEVDVWTPPGYGQDHRAAWPVVLALHGWPGQPHMLYRNLGLLHTIAGLVGQHRMAWPVVVIPRWGDVDTECTDADAQHLSETFLAVDLPAWVRQHYRVRTGPQDWATYGYSAGAYCSSMLALRHPQVFGAAISMSGYAQPSFEQPYVPFTPDSDLGRRYDLGIIAATQRPAVALYEVTDTRDRESYPSLKGLLDVARPPTRLTTVYGTGGHAVALWIPADTDAFAWLGRTLKGFAPA